MSTPTNESTQAPVSLGTDAGSPTIGSGPPTTALPMAVRKNLSCLECKRRKVKCDRKFPCSPCLVRGEPEKCKEVVRWESSGGGTATTLTASVRGASTSVEDAESSTSGAGLASVLLPPVTPASSHASTVAALQAATNYSNMAAAAAATAGSPGTLLDAATGNQILSEIRKLTSIVKDHVDRWDGEDGDLLRRRGPSRLGASLQRQNVSGKRKANGSPHGEDDEHEDHGPSFGPGDGGTQTSDTSTSRNAIDRPTRPSDEEVQMLEEFALSHRAKRGRIVDALEEEGCANQGPSDQSDEATQPGQHRTEANGSHRPSQVAPLIPSYGDSGSLPSPDVIQLAAELVSSGPSPDLARALGTHYYERVDFLTRCVDRTRYIQLRERMMSFVDPLEAVRSVPVAFVCVHLALLAAALHYFDDEQDATRLGLGEAGPSANELSLWCAAAARRLLFASHFLTNPQVDHLACVVVLSQVECDSIDLVEGNWALIGCAIRVAQSMGLGRLSETARGRKVASAMFASRAEMELAKRVWWNLVHLDTAHGTAHRGQYSLQPWHFETARPANADVVEGNVVVDAKKGAYTQASFLLARVQLIEIDRDIIEARLAPGGGGKHGNTTGASAGESGGRRGGVAPSFVSSIDKRVSDIMDGLPKELHFENLVEAESITVQSRIHMMESILLEMAGQDRQVRLYRPALVSGYQPDGDAHAKECCVRASEAILDLVQTARQRCPIILRYWKAIAAALSAALTLYTDLLFDSSSKGHSRTRKRSALRALAATFETMEATSPARSAASLLRGLLVAELDLRGSSEGTTEDDKRDARSIDRIGPFRKLVKTVLSAAALNDSSPASSPVIYQRLLAGSPSSSPSSAHLTASTPHLASHAVAMASASSPANQVPSRASPIDSDSTRWVFDPSPAASSHVTPSAWTTTTPWRPMTAKPTTMTGGLGLTSAAMPNASTAALDSSPSNTSNVNVNAAANAAGTGAGAGFAASAAHRNSRNKTSMGSGASSNYTTDDAALDSILSGSLGVEEWMRSLGAVPGL